MRRGEIIGPVAGRTLLETLIVLALVSVLLVVAIERYVLSVKPVKEAALVIELSNMRNAVTHYVLLERKLPASLKELTETSIEVPRKELSGEYKIMVVGKYVESATVDQDGWPLDPFGYRYWYDPATGRVRAGAPGYEKW